LFSDDIVVHDLQSSASQEAAAAHAPAGTAAATNNSSSSSSSTSNPKAKYTATDRSNAAFMDADELEYLTDNLGKTNVASEPQQPQQQQQPQSRANNLLIGNMNLKQQEKSSLFGEEIDLETDSRPQPASASRQNNANTLFGGDDEDGDIFISSQPQQQQQPQPHHQQPQQAVGALATVSSANVGTVSPAPSGGWEL
jgi:hypothetical protein